jgi:Tfp pilus assembly protein PilF
MSGPLGLVLGFCHVPDMATNPDQTAIDRVSAALRRDPANAGLLVDLGNAYGGANRWHEAADVYRQAVARRPDLAATHFGLGNALGQMGQLDEAIGCFERAASIDPKLVAARANLGVALSMRKRTVEAVVVFRAALLLAPDNAALHANLANALREQGNLAEAAEDYRRALALDPDPALASQTHRNLTDVLIELGRVDETFAHYMRHAALEYGRPRRAAPGVGASPHKVAHDREQLQYMIEAGIAAASRLGERAGSPDPFNGFFHIEGGARLPAAVVNPGNDTAAVEARWAESAPKIVVVDDLLSPDALSEVRRFCWGSTIWRGVHANGYVGAFPEYGFATPLLAQIAGELRAKFPRIFGPHTLRHIWGFKYDSRLKGINIHADFAAVNVNFWITPDEANLDPASGGLVVWNVPAPLDWDFDKYNTDNHAIRDFLSRNKASSVRIPYRANRAVIFDSDLFHETDRIDFKEGYRNRRINVTLLYGLRDNGEGRV